MKKIFLLRFISCAACVAALGAVVCAATLQDGVRADAYYREGAKFALEGRLAEAASAFERVVSLDQSNGNAYYSLGNVYAEMGRWADAVNAYYKAVSLNKEDVEAYNALGIALGMRGQYRQAASAFEKAIKIYPKWAEPYYNLSQARRHLHQDDEARAAYTRAVKLRPDYATRPPQRFTAAGAKPDTPRSEKAAANTAANTDAVAANTAAAGVLPETLFTGPPAPADARARDAAAPPSHAGTADRATPADSNDARAYFDLGVKQTRAGHYEEATLAFRRAVLLDRNNARAYSELGDAYAALGRWRESVDAYEQAARLRPDDPKIYQGLGRSYAKLRETVPAPEAAGDTRGAGAKAPQPSGTTADAERAKGLSADARSGGTTAGNVGARTAPPRTEQARGVASAPVTKAVGDVDPTAVYRVGPGDVLDVRVFDGGERRTTSFEVTPTGLLAYPSLSEPLNVAGLTTEEIAARLGAELRRQDGARADPDVAIGVRQYASHAIIISGMVKDAGTKILQREGVPLYVIIAYAQPLPGAGQAVVAARATGRVTTVDLSDTRATRMLVRPGDVINVRAPAEQFFYVAGAVRQPGQKKFHPELTLTQAVLAAGGVSEPRAVVAVISRQAEDGRLASLRFDLKEIGAGRVPDPVIQAGDRIEVLR
ncbi:MAG TPA: tetratricopeptide repeat protein [Pyrinomonadaceae bacterium]|nr:tetratricopeptide repeat protein [Pyrinomonadaceae bacterium]